MPTTDLPDDDEAPRETAPLETAATKKFGLRWHDRPALYRETAEAASDVDLPFWLVLLLSGTIALFGLALNATAVVIGAMLVAPLLGPLLGLSLALAVGDGRLAVQTAATIALGAAAVVALSALLTLVLPFQEVTAEIAARTRPTTLDLAIAVASGLAGAVVTVSREARLSASIPGVAIAVALIPPLAVAGFGIGTGLQWDLISGALLLFGANLGGIVLSGMLAFLLVGMHRPDVVDAARAWHRDGTRTGLAARLARSSTLGRLHVFATPRARVALVLVFVVVVSVPLASSLTQVVREVGIRQAVDGIGRDVEAAGGFVLGRTVDIGDGATAVRFRIATEDWIGEDERARLADAASAAAGEPVTVALDQVLVSDREASALRASPAATTDVPVAPSPAGPPSPPELLNALDGRIESALGGLALPDGVEVLGAQTSFGAGRVRLVVTYAADRRLPASSEVMIARQLGRALGLPDDATEAAALTPQPLPADSASAARLAQRLAPFPRLRVAVTGDSAAVRAGVARLLAGGVPRGAVQPRPRPDAGPARLRFRVAPPSSGS